MAIQNYHIHTAQTEAHPNLTQLVKRHEKATWERPIPTIQKQVFEEANAYVKMCNKPIVLDTGCGRGESTYHLSKRFPEHLVIGIDKSEVRLQSSKTYAQKNILFVRANLIDFWYQIYLAKWPVSHQFLLYPNPWPKKEAIKHRWQGHPIFPYILKLGAYIELRSNWKIYLQEWMSAVACLNQGWRGEVKDFLAMEEPITAFERKYWQTGVKTYQLILQR